MQWVAIAVLAVSSLLLFICPQFGVQLGALHCVQMWFLLILAGAYLASTIDNPAKNHQSRQRS